MSIWRDSSTCAESTRLSKTLNGYCSFDHLQGCITAGSSNYDNDLTLRFRCLEVLKQRSISTFCMSASG